MNTTSKSPEQHAFDYLHKAIEQTRIAMHIRRCSRLRLPVQSPMVITWEEARQEARDEIIFIKEDPDGPGGKGISSTRGAGRDKERAAYAGVA